MSSPGPPFVGVGWNDELENHPDARKVITQRLFDVNLWLLQYSSAVDPDLEMITNFHRTVFEDVFPEFAGRLRGTGSEFLPYDVEFGRFRGTPRDSVKAELERLAENLVQLTRSLDAETQATDKPVLDDVLKVAAYAHCELIRIHPFGNGNGRIARLMINYFTWRYLGLPVPIERPATPRYLEANRAWLIDKDIAPMIQVLRPLITDE